MQSFELPKSTVSPPKPSDARGAKSKSPRQGKKHGVSSLVRFAEKSHEFGEFPRTGIHYREVNQGFGTSPVTFALWTVVGERKREGEGTVDMFMIA